MDSFAGRLLIGDCRERLRDLPDASIDAVVTDPPYELGFMGKAWDAAGVAYDVALWTEVLRVLKPGGHLLAFGGTRTYHRMACAIEDAGFEIRDSIHWLYGSGFPKSLNVSKAIDKRGGNAHLTQKVGAALKAARASRNISISEADRFYCGGSTLWSWYEGRPAGQQMPTAAVMNVIASDWPELQELADQISEAEREVVGETTSTTLEVAPGEGRDRPQVVVPITAPATDAARQWEGWGTALKPAHEPIVVARKPLVGTVAGNVLEHGTGALNIDGCRVGGDLMVREAGPAGIPSGQGNYVGTSATRPFLERSEAVGRWPANIVLTHAADCDDQCAPGCPVAELDAQSGMSKSPTKVTRKHKRSGNSSLRELGRQPDVPCYGDTGGASRFFTVTEWDEVPFRYVAKPGKKERDAGGANAHPTVKPVELMRWLVRLVTPPGGIVLDPFLGSGTTAIAALLEGFDWRGIEMTAEYLPIIKGRVGSFEGATRARSPVGPATQEPLQLQFI